MEPEEWRELLAHIRGELTREGLAALDADVAMSIRFEEGASDREVVLAYLLALQQELRQRSRARVEELLNRMNDHLQPGRSVPPDGPTGPIRNVVVESAPLIRAVTGREQIPLLGGPDFGAALDQLDLLISQLLES